VVSLMREWSERSSNDRERNVFDTGGLQFARGTEVAKKGLALFKELACREDILADNDTLHSLGEVLQVLDGLRSKAEVLFESFENEGARENKESNYPLFLGEVRNKRILLVV
jgi:hypothetical protein